MRLWVLTGILCLSSVASAAAPAGAAPNAFRVGLYENPPKVFTDGEGAPAGIFVDLIRAIGEQEGWALTFVPCAWADCLAMLESGEIDLMPDVAYSDERDRKFDFHLTPILESWSQVYAVSGLDITGYDDLAGKRIAVLEGSIQQTVFDQYMRGFGFDVTIVPAGSFTEAFQRTADGDADAAIANNFFGDYFFREYGLAKTSIVFNPVSLYFATAEGGNQDILQAVDRHLAAWIAEPNSPYYRTLSRWTQSAPVYHVPQAVYWGIGIAGVLLAAGAGWILLLEGQVRSRTKNLRSANQALRESEERYRLLIRTSTDGILLTAPDGRIFSANPAACRIFGMTEEELLAAGRNGVADDSDPQLAQALAERLNQGEFHGELMLRRKDGAAFPAEISTALFRDAQGETRTSMIIRDITRRKDSEARLAESERKYRELVEHANSIILRWSRDGKILFLNEFGLRFFGYSSAEIFGRPVVGTIVPAVDSHGRDLGGLMEQVLADPSAFEQNINENMRRNGERVWIAWTNRMVKDEQGRISEILSVGTDISERKKAEEAIRELNATLEQRVAERTAELAVAKDRAEAADRLKSAFLATMSHELRTPLNSIIGFTGILLQEMAGPLTAEQTKQLTMVRDSARHLLALINDVLDISKIEAGQLEIHPEPFDLRASLEKVVGLVRPLAEKKGLALQADPAPEIGVFVSDVRRVEQILINLLNNAVKFTDRGVISLTASFAPFPYRAPQTALQVSIADTGIGIRPGDLQDLFQPFHQIDSGLTRQHEGTGLGLAICRRLADLLGGEIRAESEWGKGSTFTLFLPAKETPNP
ncbi:MAG: PAS domain S-box protein [Anaerolineales bacterium]|nr:PAS domain S-box protein [Anaerolineales bacterium]